MRKMTMKRMTKTLILMQQRAAKGRVVVMGATVRRALGMMRVKMTRKATGMSVRGEGSGRKKTLRL